MYKLYSFENNNSTGNEEIYNNFTEIEEKTDNTFTTFFSDYASILNNYIDILYNQINISSNAYYYELNSDII